MLPGCTSVSAALDLSLARRPSTNVRPLAMGDGDSLAPALSAGGPAARGLTGVGARLLMDVGAGFGERAVVFGEENGNTMT